MIRKSYFRSANKVLTEHNHAYSFMYYLQLDEGRLVVVTETLWPAKYEVFTLWLFTEKL